ncbi:hypothetical protein POSPLADRAFT_1153452 [Postia placenta MAD-698-R-SB12]|uniref:Uncharacterized protein n=1 Tax=Postia placenta MAD-698-R-SB12 TaxID=670580 RepID=A0A1X6MQL6_9APHY|nr:hypothetical protein POSPLADRAFT_1153452 [Postia placenta MAD-698-R-SB12]OSX58645.1 hypothetical protein POSPLADRAFT_1153452 [Postia placenta MAD-698-R-SB12]
MDIELNANIGCFFIGVIIATPLYGLTCAQVMYYVRDYSEDWIWLKSLVAVLFLLDTATSIVSFEIEYLLAAFIVIIVQSYYMRTIWILLANKPYKIPLMAVLVALTLVSFGEHSPSIPALYTKLRICHSTLPLDSNPKFSTDSLLRTLMIYAINRGILTTLWQVALMRFTGPFSTFPEAKVRVRNYNPSTTISANATMGRNIPSRSVDEEVASTSYSSRDGGRLSTLQILRKPLCKFVIFLLVDLASDLK